MDQVLYSTLGGGSSMWSNLLSPMRSLGLGVAPNLRDMALTVPTTVLLCNLASHLSLMPSNLLSFLGSWLHQEINIKIPDNRQRFFGGGDDYSDDEFCSPEISSVRNIFTAAEVYLSTIAFASKSNSHRTSVLRASTDRSGRDVILTVDNSEVITDTFRNVAIRWKLHREKKDEGESSSRGGGISAEKKYFILTFNARKAGLEIVREYLRHVLAVSEKIASQHRQLKLHTNSGYHGWNMVPFNHPACFETLAMDPEKKRKIMDDLDTFSQCREYYARIGKAWKRGYLLYGPPGTGKSTMIACIANYMKYDIYDLELTNVTNNNQLRQLVTALPSRSILVIEDIDCSLELTGARKRKTRKQQRSEEANTNTNTNVNDSKVTLSGLLNCIDGLWSTSGGERLIIFTTNYIEKLDPALIRKGRMDVQIELSYCKFEAFKVLAKNYLEIDEHPLYKKVQKLLDEVEITPADVAEELLPTNITIKKRAGESLEALITKMSKTAKK